MKTIFSDYIEEERRKHSWPYPKLRKGSCVTPDGVRCHLCHASAMDYDTEVKIKSTAFSRFWKAVTTESPPGEFQPSPMGRGYRIVTKRKVQQVRGGCIMGLIDAAGKRLLDVGSCAIEPEKHAEIYNSIARLLRHRSAQPLTATLQYIIIKGDYDRYLLIFNVAELSQNVVKASNTVSRLLTREFPSVQGVFLGEDDSDGRYYMGERMTSGTASFRRLYGSRDVVLRLEKWSLRYDVQAFSQVNLSAIPLLIQSATKLLARGGKTLYDLYCGYGLFSIGLADVFSSVRGYELSQKAVDSAIANARRLNMPHVRFSRADISPERLLRILPKFGPDDAVILDPPRHGTAEGVIEVLAERRPERVLHVFCNTERLQPDLRSWKRYGYIVDSSLVIDNFPGTDHVEVLLLLTPEKRHSGKN